MYFFKSLHLNRIRNELGLYGEMGFFLNDELFKNFLTFLIIIIYHTRVEGSVLGIKLFYKYL